MAKIIGITGPSGAGKSLLCEYISKAGIPCINADELYHSMLIPPSRCLEAIKNTFGDGVIAPDGTLDRRALSACVFNNESKLELLNRTVLPIVIEEVKKIIDTLSRDGHPAVAVDAPTLIESGFYLECDKVIAVIAPEETRIERIEERDGISHELAELRTNAQKPNAFYESAADITLINDGKLSSFEACARELINDLKKL
ncbi:MAG: dephospho-CoA kinase [Clostridia bacterium]|nr:dephospho-CoA kinase [Clostridia bacterium]